MTEKKLFQAFDLQRFRPSERLQAVIDASHARMEALELEEEELELVAGGRQPPQEPEEPQS
ncbi:MAG: hypothetical protein K5855_01175 [Oscillospiraceae bacterium]|jgi:hypothetical protein|nr:hypothetical protein [Oscillospiraceae bacterium]